MSFIVVIKNSSVFLGNVNNVIGELYAESECVGGVLGNSDNPLGLSGIYNDVGSIHALRGGGGVSGCVDKIEEINNIYNRLGIVLAESDFGGILGKIRNKVTNRLVVSSVNSYIYNVATSDALPSSGHVFGLFGSIDVSGLDILNLSGVLINQLSSYVNGLSCGDDFAGLVNMESGGGIFSSSCFDIAYSVFGAAGTDDANQCYNVISSDHDKKFYDFNNSYWFSPDSEHFAPFGKDVSFDASKLTAFGDNANEISEVADSIKVWEPATEQIELGGKNFELPVVFTKNQFLQETGLTYDQRRYTDFDDWCRKVEQEHPELLDELE